ncbi:hypothetical protein NKH61_27500 [Mesorhizobium sp. M1005]|uniref:hypothetical protein n=1 Tax=unclassified Mesorhizobium TaxID=325217 RepID=UPI003335D919
MRQEPKNSLHRVIFKRTIAPVAIGPAVTHVFIKKQSIPVVSKVLPASINFDAEAGFAALTSRKPPSIRHQMISAFLTEAA